VIKFGEGSPVQIATMESWYLVELATLQYTAGENQGCEERFTADCTKSAVIREKTCPGGELTQVSETCVSEKKCGASAKDSGLDIEPGQEVKVTLPNHDVKTLNTGRVQFSVKDKMDVTIHDVIFVDAAAPEAGLIWAIFLVVWQCLAF